MKLSERFTGGLGVQITSEVTSVKDEIREWTGVFHNHSSIYTIQKRLYKDDIYTEYKNVCTKTTSTLQRRHVQHLRGSVTYVNIHIDIVGPLPPSQGYTHILTLIDRTTRWAEAVPLSSTTAASCAEAFCTHWISRFGLPHTLTSDRGPQFTSSVGLISLHSSMSLTFTPRHFILNATALLNVFIAA
jgi:IS30 family transposase